MKVKKKHNFLKSIILLVFLLLATYLGALALNQFNSNYEDLSSVDKQVLKEFEELSKSEKVKGDLWKNYDLCDKPLLFVNKKFNGYSYIVNPKKPISKLFAKEIKMPKEYSTTKIYRVSGFMPSIIKIKLIPGNFNTIGSKTSFLGSDVYFLKYNKENVFKKYSSDHFSPFLAHEAFHYYMQNNWANGDRFANTLSENDINLLANEYNILTKISEELKKSKPENLKLLTNEYVSSVDQRIKANPEYMKKELSVETAEGTATYVGIKAAKITNYDFGIMYFDNAKNIPFSDIIPTYKKGKLDKSLFVTRFPYDTGALLCFLCDKLSIPNWQERLNEQTLEKPLNLYNILKEWTEKNK